MTRRASAKVSEILEDLPTLETDRLILRKMTPGDAEAMFAYASDLEVTRYVICETHRSIEDLGSSVESKPERTRFGASPLPLRWT